MLKSRVSFFLCFCAFLLCSFAQLSFAMNQKQIKKSSKSFAGKYIVILGSKEDYKEIVVEQKKLAKKGVKTQIATGDYLTKVTDGWFILVAKAFSSKRKAWRFVKKLRKRKVLGYAKKAGAFQARSTVATGLCSKAKKPKLPSNQSIYFVVGKALWKKNPKNNKETKIMPYKLAHDHIVTGPYGRYIYASVGLKIYQLNLKKKKVRLFKKLKDPFNATCEGLELNRGRLVCYAISSMSALKYRHAKRHMIRLPRQSGKRIFDKHRYVRTLKGFEYHIRFHIKKKKMHISLQCGKGKPAAWGSIDVPKAYKKDVGKPTITIASGGRILFVFFPTIGGDTGTEGYLYSSVRGKFPMLLDKEAVHLPQTWSADGGWLLYDGELLDLLDYVRKAPENAFWGK